MGSVSVGERMRQRRIDLGMGQGQLAKRVNQFAGLASGRLTRNEISRYERGVRTPHDWLPFIARALGVSVSWLTGQPAPAPVALTDALHQFEQGVGLTIDRRTFLADSSGLALTVVTAESSPPRPVPPESVAYFRKQIDTLWEADAVHSPRALLAPATAQFHIATHLAANSRGDLRGQLWKMAAALAGLITWLHQDIGQLDQAASWGTRTLELAHRSHDRHLVAHALTNRAMVAMDAGDGPTTVELALAALADDERHLCAKVRVQALQQAAHGYALTGDRDSCDRLLDRADTLVASIDDDHPWGNATKSPRYVETQRATCYSRMRLGPEAVRLWDQVVPAAEWRNAGVFAARKAAALADSRQPEAATAALEDAVRVTEQVDSARLQRELRLAWTRLSPWHGTPLTEPVRTVFADAGLSIDPQG